MNAPVVEGEVIAGKYRVDRVVGRGGMGMVVAASHLFLPQRVAIKLLLSDDSPALVQRFLREARAAARLKGEHVVRVLDVGELGSGVPYIVMEFLEGEDLSDVIRARGQLDVAEAADYVLQACVAMAEAHAAGIVHRDLKPANLFLTTAPGGAKLIKVLDFGISKEMPSGGEGGGASLTQTREVLGSPIYMPPEQMRSSRSVDARSDIWALGAMLYRALVGRPPFEAPALAELVLQVASAEPVPPSALRSDLPLELEGVILHCLQKDPARRPQTVADLALALAPFAPAGGQERAERAARILRAPPAAPSRPSSPSVPPPRPGPDSSPSATSAPTASLLPTTRVLARTPAQPTSRRTTLRMAIGAAATAALALAIWGAVALRDSAPEERAALEPAAEVPQGAPAARGAEQTAAEGEGDPRRTGQGMAGGEADPPIAQEPRPVVQVAAPLPSVSPGPAPTGEAARLAPAQQQRRRAPATPSADPSPARAPSSQARNPFEIQLK
ncbi:protein kinase domain-containing protein [Sorangium sp. So ce1182]|uniref:serine/threonine-protein kinase n=1 Tax=Sorangium sp. So ce1182 TaxID=3133334 RepID=UPI003F61FBEE